MQNLQKAFRKRPSCYLRVTSLAACLWFKKATVIRGKSVAQTVLEDRR